MLARIRSRFVWRPLAILALLVSCAAPARAAGFGFRTIAFRGGFRARSNAIATHFTLKRSTERRRAPGKLYLLRRRHNGAEHARHLSSDKHSRKSTTATQATSSDTGIGTAPRVETSPGGLTFISMPSDRLTAMMRSGRAPSRAPPSSLVS